MTGVDLILSTLALKPRNPDYRAMNKTASAASNDTTNQISRRTALGLGATVTAGMLLSPELLAAAPARRKVVVWSEGTANVDPGSKEVYPNDINTAIAEGLKPLEVKEWEIVKASLNDSDQGISDALLNSTDVLIWWGHKKHGDVKDELVSKIVSRVKEGNDGFHPYPFLAFLQAPQEAPGYRLQLGRIQSRWHFGGDPGQGTQPPDL